MPKDRYVCAPVLGGQHGTVKVEADSRRAVARLTPVLCETRSGETPSRARSSRTWPGRHQCLGVQGGRRARDRSRQTSTSPVAVRPAVLMSTISCVRSSRWSSLDRTPRASAGNLLERPEIERHEAMEPIGKALGLGSPFEANSPAVSNLAVLT